MRTLYIALRGVSTGTGNGGCLCGEEDEDVLQAEDVGRRPLRGLVRVEDEVLGECGPPVCQLGVELLEHVGQLGRALVERALRVDAAKDVAHGDGQAAQRREGRDAVRGRAGVARRAGVVREGLPVLQLLVRVEELYGHRDVRLL